MKERTKIRSVLISIVLLLSFVFPMAIQASHFCEEHEHSTSHEKSSYVHEKSTDCTICDFHFFSFSYDVYRYTELVKATTPSKLVISLITIVTTTFINNNESLRGPPSFLVN